MKIPFQHLGLAAAAVAGLFLVTSPVVRGDDKKPAPAKKSTRTAEKKAAREASQAAELPEVSLLDAARNGAAHIEAEGLGDGRMNVAVTNNTNRPLKVVLPPGLVASGATGQMMGGMGGMGGGMGGMGMGGMGGGMGGMGGGMGGMGGGMGGMGGGMGGMGGGMGGGMTGGGMGGMGGGTMPASMGMMMVGRLVMMLVGDMSSWNFASLMSGGMMGGMGMMGGGMGGMGGGMGGGMMGGMGGGFRSVPPTGAPFAVVQPNQTRNLATRVVNLGGPNEEGKVDLPAQGEKLTLGDVSEANADPRVASALKRLSAEKAPTVITQLVLWNLASGLDWNTIARLAKDSANPYEVALARQFVANLDASSKVDAGRIFVEVRGGSALAVELRGLFKDRPILGLKAESGVPARPDGPSVALTIDLGASDAKEAQVVVKATDGRAQAWVDAGKFAVPAVTKDGKPDAAALADSVAAGVLVRMVDAKLVKGKAKAKGRDAYTIRVDNYSPLILNGLALTGTGEKSEESIKLLSGIAIAPRKSFTIPAAPEVVESLGLKQGVRIMAVDLSGL